MDLQKIKKLCEEKRIEIKALAGMTGMTEQNLHRCIRINKIQAADLEKIAIALGVDIGIFFDNEGHPNAVASGDGSVAVGTNTGSIATGDNRILHERVAMLKRILEEKERLIQVLLTQINK